MKSTDLLKLLYEDSGKKQLYISRYLLNGDEVVSWAKKYEIPNIVDPSKMHVTLMFSSEPLYEDDITLNTNPVTIESGRRKLQKFNDALVLRFASKAFGERWIELRRLGASWDYPSYMPHISISYDAGDVDIDDIEPYTGELQFGPEVMTEL